MATLQLPMSHVMKRTTLVVTLTGIRTWKVRLWLATHLMKLAARTLGCGFRVDYDRGTPAGGPDTT